MLQTLVDTAVLGADWLRLERPRLPRAARKRTSRHLALFAWGLPPTSTVGVHRPLSFLRYGSQHGWRIDAFGSKAPDSLSEHGDELLARVPPETTLHVVPPASREPSYRLFPRVDGGFTNALKYAHYAIAAMANDPPDVVLASGPPFFTFVAALLVARRFGVPFVLDYRDEWTECPYDNVMKGGHNHAWEQRCLREASAVLFTTESHVQHQLAKFPELDASRAHFLPNGWEPDDFAGHEIAPVTHSPASTVMRVAHIGSMPRHKSPEEFLASLRQLFIDEPEWLNRIHVQFVGRRTGPSDRALDAFEFPAAIEIIGHVSKREANRRMQESDILLLLAGPGTERYLNAKLFDYVAAHRPILAFGTPGESPALIERLGVGVHCAPGSARALRDSLERLSGMDMSRNDERVSEWLQAHRRDVLASRVFDIIESVAARTSASS
jgi:glycosyltransferase involved in cell wall biosynthesis